MRNVLLSRKVISSLLASAVLLYCLVTTPTLKVFLVPFLICSLSMACRELALISGKDGIAEAFQALFVAGFLVLIGGFLFSEIIYAKEGGFALFLATVPFLAVGVALLGRMLRRGKLREGAREEEASEGEVRGGGLLSAITFPVVMSTLLVGFTLMAGVVLLFMGIRKGQADLAFAGAFFAFGSLVFVLAALKARGVFDGLNFDVLGAYMGAVVAAFGFGAVALKYGEMHSLLRTVQEFGPWIIVPALMFVVGVAQLIKCLLKRPKR